MGTVPIASDRHAPASQYNIPRDRRRRGRRGPGRKGPVIVERTLIILKPDAVQRRLVGAITQRFERKGLRIAGMKLMRISRELAETHYSPHKDKPFYESLVNFMTSEPVVAMALDGYRAIDVTRKLMGMTFGYKAEPGTIRGDYGISNQYNLVHGSDSAESAQRELELFFSPAELLEYSLADQNWNESE